MRRAEAERQKQQASHAVRVHFLHFARLNGMAQQEQVEILDQLSEAPLQEQLEYISKMKERAEAVAMRLRQEAHLDAQRAERVAQLERHEAALEHQKAAEEGVVVLGGGDAANEDVLEAADVEADDEAEKLPVFAPYEVRKSPYGDKHPTCIVESYSMAAVEPPDVTYEPSGLPESLLHGGRGHGSADWGRHDEGAPLRRAAGGVVYAGQRHEQLTGLQGRYCGGFYIGDGTGLGKGREIAACILDNFAQGRRRAIWCSVSSVLALQDAKRDLRDLGRDDVACYPLHKLPYGEAGSVDMEDGVLFCTYSSLISQNKQKERRIDQIVQWAGEMVGGLPEEFDGVLAFDEAHRAKNHAGTKTGEAVLQLQRRLPNARVLYVSATGAADVKELGYMERLGLWGGMTPFRDFDDFAREIQGGGGVGDGAAGDGHEGPRPLRLSRAHLRGLWLRDPPVQPVGGGACRVRRRRRLWLRMLEVIEKCTRLTSDHGGSTPRYFWGAQSKHSSSSCSTR